MGQGGSKSKTTVNILNDLAVNAVQRTISDCVATATQTQIISAQYVAGDVDLSGTTLTQGATVNTTCMLTSSKQNEMRTSIAQALTQYAKSQGPAILGILGSSESNANTNITNRLQTGITQEDIQRSTANAVQEQRIQFGIIGGNFIMKGATLEQTARVVAQGIVNSQQVSSVIQDIGTKIDQTAESKTSSPFADIFESLTWSGALVVIAIILVIGGVMIYPIMLLFGIGGAVGERAEGGYFKDFYDV